MTEDEAAVALFKGLNQHLDARGEALKANKRRLAHYTSAENALNIVRSKSIWLRSAALMNDFSEISFGASCLGHALREQLPTITSILEPYHSGLAAEVVHGLVEMEFTAKNYTYLTSLAEQSDSDDLGKLSMWRAYGGPVAGVAIVFNTEAVAASESEELKAFLLPVQYGFDEFMKVFTGTIEALKGQSQLLEMLSRNRVAPIVFHTLQDLMLTTKHPGFIEEDEWRVIYSPHLFSSEYIPPHVESVGGIPQVVHSIRFEDQPGLNMPELTLDELLHRVIVGPCQYPEQVASALHIALENAGVSNPRERIRISQIPLRQRG